MTVGVCVLLPRTGGNQDQWDYALCNFAPDDLYVIGDEALAPETNVFSKMNATYLDTAADLPTEPTLVIMAPTVGVYIQGDESLADFVHPAGDVIYLFGPDKTHLSDDDHLAGREADHLVYIPTDSIDNMWSWNAYVVTMWDRRCKADG